MKSQIANLQITSEWLSIRAEQASRETLRMLGRWIVNREQAYQRTPVGYQVRVTHDGWLVARHKCTLPIRVFPEREQAIEAARALAKQQRTYVDIFNHENALQMRQSFSGGPPLLN